MIGYSIVSGSGKMSAGKAIAIRRRVVDQDQHEAMTFAEYAQDRAI
ncbi:hypothetical protein [Mesorhizobium sp. M0491]